MHECDRGSAGTQDASKLDMNQTSMGTERVVGAGDSLDNLQKGPRPANRAPMSGGKRLKGVFAEGTPDRPLVTVITAVLNGQPYVEGCLDSVINQDYPHVEHILIDGGSTDGTVDVLRRYDDRVALWTSEPNRGLYDAWNIAVPQARGEWICFIGIDDEFLPGGLSAYMALAAKNPEAEYLNSLVRMVHHSGYERTFGRPWKWKEFSRWMRWAQVGSMHKRSLLERLGPFDLGFGACGDYELLLRARDGLKSAYIPVETAMMRWGGCSDKLAAGADATRAKIITGGKNPLIARMELVMFTVRYYLRPLRRRYYFRSLRKLVASFATR